MTDVDGRTTDMFVSLPARLRVGGHGPTSNNHLGYLDPLAKRCLEVEAIAAAGNTPEEILLHRVARLTGCLIATLALSGGETIVREWVATRSQQLLARLNGTDSAGAIRE